MERSRDDAHPDSWVRWLDEMVARCAEAMERELGDSTSCRVHRDGRVTGGLKYQEGRLTAFAEARRMAISGAGVDDRRMAAFAARWNEELARRLGSEHPSPPWVAYATGGAEAAAETTAEWRRDREARRGLPRSHRDA